MVEPICFGTLKLCGNPLWMLKGIFYLLENQCHLTVDKTSVSSNRSSREYTATAVNY